MTTTANTAARVIAAAQRPPAPLEIRDDIRCHAWDWQTPLPEHVDALAAVMRFCAASLGARKRRKPWLTLLGGSGRGKSHLCRKFAEWAKGVSPGRYYWRWLDVLEICRDMDDPARRRHFIARMDDCRPVVIDDLGSGHETAYANAIACEIAERRTGLPTLWTANLELRTIAERIDARVASRMRRNGGAVFVFEQAGDFDANATDNAPSQ